jgi:hypothetical protein
MSIRAWQLPLLAAAVTGCYTYTPLPDQRPAPPADVRVLVSSDFRQQWPDVIGPGRRALEGRVLDWDESAVLLEVPGATLHRTLERCRGGGGEAARPAQDRGGHRGRQRCRHPAPAAPLRRQDERRQRRAPRTRRSGFRARAPHLEMIARPAGRSGALPSVRIHTGPTRALERRSMPVTPWRRGAARRYAAHAQVSPSRRARTGLMAPARRSARCTRTGSG